MVEDFIWNETIYKNSGSKYTRKYLMLSKDVLSDRVLLLFKKYKVSEEDAGKITAIFGILTAKEVGERTNLRGGFRR